MNEEKSLAHCIFNTFNTPEGKTTLAYMLSKAGFFSTDKAQINPEVLAFMNLILAEGHIGLNGDMGKYVNSLLSSFDEEGLA